jgi:Phage Terminase
MAKRLADPVTRYAQAVVGGQVVASHLVRLACQRHLDDVAAQHETGLVWRPERALEAIDFFREILILPERTDAADAIDGRADAGDRMPFVLQPFQAFIVGSIFGWYTAAGHRRFRECYIETAKGSGKTPLGAGMMLYLLIGAGLRRGGHERPGADRVCRCGADGRGLAGALLGAGADGEQPGVPRTPVVSARDLQRAARTRWRACPWRARR